MNACPACHNEGHRDLVKVIKVAGKSENDHVGLRCADCGHVETVKLEPLPRFTDTLSLPKD